MLLAVARIVATYRTTSQGFDEPCHVAAAIEYLDKHTYTLDPVHPPLSRIAIGLPLYLARERYPKWPQDDPRLRNYNDVGNSVLYDDNHYLRNLSLARIGVLPFFILCAALVFTWAWREFGALAGLMAVALFTTVPTVLAFAGMAYSDMPTACMQFAAIVAFALWLQEPSAGRTLLLGAAVGLAFACKLTSVLFLFAAGTSIALLRMSSARKLTIRLSTWVKGASLAGLIAAAVLWGTYGFQFGRVQESMQLSPESIPSFQHFPRVVGRVARAFIVKDSVVPAPALLRGVAQAWVLNKSAPGAYLLGKTKSGGWWYFFLIGMAVKAPIPLLALCAAGTGFAIRRTREEKWAALAPAIAIAAILLITMPVKYNAGVRHVLVLFPLMAVLGGYGASALLELSGRPRLWGRAFLVTLLSWQAISTIQARHDYIAYFNEFTGAEPSKILVNGCDLDCGQDVFKLRDELRRRQISHVSLAMWSSADISRMGLPDFEILQPSQSTSGWVAVSDRARLEGEVFHTAYPANAFEWLAKYSPVTRVGKTVSLYFIPEGTSPASERPQLNVAVR
jgi:4-amino-4-deoxy-L-arabinose transferase-like glycosyltransferase